MTASRPHPRRRRPTPPSSQPAILTPNPNPNPNPNSPFLCSICLSTAADPVVTPCGHLFCWPCLYRWLHSHSPLHDCPVCKAPVRTPALTPIYTSSDASPPAAAAAAASEDDPIPPRPSGRADDLGALLERTGAVIDRVSENLERIQSILTGVGVVVAELEVRERALVAFEEVVGVETRAMRLRRMRSPP